jgi:2-hydroxychromene-2-carboxylate isomerase
MDDTIEFYFDFISPFSYLAYQRLPAIVARFRCRIVPRVLNLAEAKLLAGNTGPTSRSQPLKRRYNQKDKERWARRYGVPIDNPTSYGPDRLNMGVFFAEDRGQVADYIAYAWRRVWGEGGDMAGEALLRDVARHCGWGEGAFLAFTQSPDAAARYKRATQAAHDKGVFGVPTMMIGGEMWWGNDRLDFLEEFLRERAAAPATAG